jgi:hypothetical protein
MWYGSRATDKYSGTRYEYRRAWVEDKVLWLSSVFTIGICAYVVMSNHVHLVLCVDKDKAVSWSDKQVVGRWHRLHRGTLLSQKFMRNAKRTLQRIQLMLKVRLSPPPVRKLIQKCCPHCNGKLHIIWLKRARKATKTQLSSLTLKRTNTAMDCV